MSTICILIRVPEGEEEAEEIFHEGNDREFSKTDESCQPTIQEALWISIKIIIEKTTHRHKTWWKCRKPRLKRKKILKAARKRGSSPEEGVVGVLCPVSATERSYSTWTEAWSSHLRTLESKQEKADWGRRWEFEVPRNWWWIYHFFPLESPGSPSR